MFSVRNVEYYFAFLKLTIFSAILLATCATLVDAWVTVPGAAENQQLDPKDESYGSLVLPEDFKDELTPLPRRIQPDDPTDDVLNRRNVFYKGNPDQRLWKNPPCEWYHERHDSEKNRGRRDGCGKIAYNLMEYSSNGGPALPKNCPQPLGGTCFQFRGLRSRCYLWVQFKGEKPLHRYVLVDKCL